MIGNWNDEGLRGQCQAGNEYAIQRTVLLAQFGKPARIREQP